MTSGAGSSRCPSASSGSSRGCSTARSGSAGGGGPAPPFFGAAGGPGGAAKKGGVPGRRRGGEESAGASFLRRDGGPWATDKDGLIPCLLAAEMTARDGRDPGERYRGLEERFGSAVYKRTDVEATPEEKAVLKQLSPDQVSSSELAGEPITDVLTEAPGNGAPIGGLKVVGEGGWFAARPSGTEDVYKVYAESFRGEEHLDRIIAEAQEIVKGALGG